MIGSIIGIGAGFLGTMFFVVILLGILSIIAPIWVIYDIIVNNKRLSDGMKVLWIVLAICFGIITAIIYYLVGRKANLDPFKKK